MFSAALIVVLVVQFRLRRYVPAVYWLAVVLISVVGTLLTDQLTDGQGVPLWVSTTGFAVLLAVVFPLWYARERTLSIHSIVTTRREAFYWLAVLVTFALGTAAGDWTLDLTGWGPGPAVLLPAGLIALVMAAWKLGAGPVLTFGSRTSLPGRWAPTSATSSPPTARRAVWASARSCVVPQMGDYPARRLSG